MQERKSRKRIASTLALTALLAVLLAACGELTPSGKVDGFLINEVYTGTSAGTLQWVEILANGQGKDDDSTLDLRGVTLNTAKGSVDLGTLKGVVFLPPLAGRTPPGPKFAPLQAGTPVPAGAYIVVASNPAAFAATYPASKVVALDGSAVLGSLDPKDDALTLRSGDDLLDQIGWGSPNAETLNKIKSGGDVNMKLPAAGIGEPAKTLGRTPPSGPTRDSGKPGAFSIHDTVTPGGTVARPDKYNFLLNEITNLITIVGGLSLYLVFIMIAVVARRFETLAQQRTYWQLLLAAPTGILIYDVVTIISFILNGQLVDPYRIIGFAALFLSGIACLAIINVFRNIAKDILASQ